MNDPIELMAKTIWLAEFERAFSRRPSDPWENQADKIKDVHRNTARKLMECGAIELLEERPAAALRQLVIEECAAVLDECAQDWNRIRDPGMANNARCYAKKIRDLA
jgi:hypothetical protein